MICGYCGYSHECTDLCPQFVRDVQALKQQPRPLLIQRVECGCTSAVVSKPFCEHDKA